MVYHGPSRGCNSCKRRRKKCDETRPSCLRCTRAGRTCSGYEFDELPVQRRYEAPPRNPLAHSGPILPRKCSLPKRVPFPGSDILPRDTIPRETTVEESHMLALRSFLYDFSTSSINRNISRGYLSGLVTLVQRLGPSSNVAKACQAVAFANRGRPLNRPRFVRKAQLLYQDLLLSSAKALNSSRLTGTTELRLIALMMGLFQVIIADEHDIGNHEVHAKGLWALMGFGYSPSDPLNLFGDAHKEKAWSIFSITTANTKGDELDFLLQQVYSIWIRSEITFEEGDLRALQDESIALERRFSKWAEDRATEFKPIVAGHIDLNRNKAGVEVGCWPGRIETYFDIYVAAVWNVFRAARIILIHQILDTFDRLKESAKGVGYIGSANQLAEDMAASVPFHLTDCLQVFLNQQHQKTSPGPPEPGRFLGGLLLMHPLYIASRASFLSDNIRQYFGRCLLWIGSEMGFGQASVLAKTIEIDRDYLVSGFTLIWSGFLI
ncbi:hypothetical protein BX600DRAFT_491961 [Xylariales sp. PMI_506]|nr:hypothetical protein BX600DRAFT_491961 [Xylariales sp. PMI_506]